MTSPVLILSDTHYHNYTQYAQANKVGLNTRLADILRATVAAARQLHKLGGNVIIHAGDVFHVRGSLPPSVLNPVLDCYQALIAAGFKIYMLSGNHDLESKESNRLSSSVTALESVGVVVVAEPLVRIIDGKIWHLVPWMHDLKDLKREIGSVTADNTVIHAPLNDVIVGIPDNGLTPADFEKAGCKRVFAGHYHHHKRFAFGVDNSAYSIGALTHQNWGDVDTKAGYIIAWPDRIEHYATAAPKFQQVEITNLASQPDYWFTDNYIKVTGGDFTDPSDIQAIKDEVIVRGAKAVIVEGLVKRPAVTRAGTPATTAPTVESILSDYLDRTYPGEADVKNEALEIIRMLS